MHIIARLGGLAAATALIAGLCAPAQAVPSFDVKSGWHQPKPSLPGCTDTIPDASHGSDTAASGQNGQARLSNGNCRLAGADRDTGWHTNDGVNVDQSIASPDDAPARERHPDPEQPLDKPANSETLNHIELSDTDHKMHAYAGDGMNRQDLGAVSGLDAQQDQPTAGPDGRYARFDPADHSHRLTLAMGGSGEAGHLGNAASAVGGASMPAIPEPATCAMLLAGLAVILLVRRRQSGQDA